MHPNPALGGAQIGCWVLAVDIGTASVAAAVHDGSRAEAVVFGPGRNRLLGRPLMTSRRLQAVRLLARAVLARLCDRSVARLRPAPVGYQSGPDRMALRGRGGFFKIAGQKI